MKQIFISALATMLIAFTACNNTGKKVQEAENKAEIVEITEIPVDKVIELAPEFVDKEIDLSGYVTHTCKHSGKRCFLVG
ncbi:MAG: hypothetical protein ACK5HT_02020, partial [Draconibacterium sp.]